MAARNQAEQQQALWQLVPARVQPPQPRGSRPVHQPPAPPAAARRPRPLPPSHRRCHFQNPCKNNCEEGHSLTVKSCASGRRAVVARPAEEEHGSRQAREGKRGLRTRRKPAASRKRRPPKQRTSRARMFGLLSLSVRNLAYGRRDGEPVSGPSVAPASPRLASATPPPSHLHCASRAPPVPTPRPTYLHGSEHGGAPASGSPQCSG